MIWEVIVLGVASIFAVLFALGVFIHLHEIIHKEIFKMFGIPASIKGAKTVPDDKYKDLPEPMAMTRLHLFNDMLGYALGPIVVILSLVLVALWWIII